MKKIKKIMAMLLAMVMVLGMTVTAMAAPNSAQITVNNLDKNAKVAFTQVIAPDTQKETGWKFVNDALSAYKTDSAFGEQEEQSILKQLINYQATIETPNLQPESYPYAGAGIATATQIAEALKEFNKNITASSEKTTFTAESAGVYAIKVSTTSENIVYSDMAAYVKFCNYDPTTGVPGNLQNVEVNAKKTEFSVTKNHKETNNVVAIGDKVEYTIKTTIPYFEDHKTNIKYEITDTITGAEYERVAGVTLEQVKITSVKLGGADVTEGGIDVGKESPLKVTGEIIKQHEGGESFTLVLSDVAAAKKEDGSRKYANQELEIKYNAIVKAERVNNNVQINNGSDNHPTGEDDVYTGTVTMTKTGENQTPLEKAGFAVYRTKDNVKEYAVVEKDEETSNRYVVTGWEKVDEFTNENRSKFMVTTDEKGQVVVGGLDKDDNYWFKEIQAPEGYSINETDSQVKWDEVTDVTKVTGQASMTDTKLSSLPSTGGIGTTIFTIGGCAIMVAAAGLFFASRRKANK